jgi:type II secretory pathway pseudopilin PulG
VVIVILGILLAIAIPALTGYIQKAQDKEWEARAYDAQVAFRSLIAEDLGNGTLGKGVPTSGPYSTYLIDGAPQWAATQIKGFGGATLSAFASGYSDPSSVPGSALIMYSNRAAELLGLNPVASSDTPGFFEVAFYAPRPSTYTVSDAPAFRYRYYPEGNLPSKPIVIVLFGFSGFAGSYNTLTDLEDDIKTNGVIDLDAGYRVYHVIR